MGHIKKESLHAVTTAFILYKITSPVRYAVSLAICVCLIKLLKKFNLVKPLQTCKKNEKNDDKQP